MTAVHNLGSRFASGVDLTHRRLHDVVRHRQTVRMKGNQQLSICLEAEFYSRRMTTAMLGPKPKKQLWLLRQKRRMP